MLWERACLNCTKCISSRLKDGSLETQWRKQQWKTECGLGHWWRTTSTWMAIDQSSFFAAAYAANNAQAVIMALWEEYENILDDDNLPRCFISTDSRIEKQREYQEPTSIRNNACYPTAVLYSYQNSFHHFFYFSQWMRIAHASTFANKYSPFWVWQCCC